LAIALVAASAADFTAVGHALALILGLGLSSRLSTVTRWTLTRTVLLAVSIAFGYHGGNANGLCLTVVAGR